MINQLDETRGKPELAEPDKERHYTRLPRYTLPDFNRTLRGRLMQKIVDYLHSSGD